MKISYYDLLGLIRENEIPVLIEVKLPSVSYSKQYHSTYDIDGSFLSFDLVNLADKDENYQSYLSDTFFESDMFTKCITIIDSNKKIVLPTGQTIKNTYFFDIIKIIEVEIVKRIMPVDKLLSATINVGI